MKNNLSISLALCLVVPVLAGVAPTSLQRQVEDAADGATVRIPAGVYRIDRPIVVPEGKTLKIVGDGADRTIVNAGGRTNGFVFLSRGANLLEGVTVRNGRGAASIPGDGTVYAGGVVMRGGVIRGCRVEGCVNEVECSGRDVKALGGGIVTWGAVEKTVVKDCAVRTRTTCGGGTHPLKCSGGGIVLYDGPCIRDCEIENCVAEALAPGTAQGGFGGGVEIFGRGVLANSRVAGCRASVAGAGVHLNSGGSVKGCEIVSNRLEVLLRWDGVNGGAGVCACGDGCEISGTKFRGNEFSELKNAVDAPSGGGALMVTGSGTKVIECAFRDNVGYNGGAVFVGKKGAAITGCRFEGNRAVRLCADVFRVNEDAYRPNPATRWMSGSLGVFQHRLYGPAPKAFESMKLIDPKRMAAQLKDIGADFFCITLNQCEPSFITPNDTLEGMCGFKKGERCWQRDIPMELAEELGKVGIRLMLYSTGTPPREERRIVEGVGYVYRGPRKDPDYTREGARRWASCFEEWSRRYGTKVSGWWIDGCYADRGFEKTGAAEFFAKALKSGNPQAVVTFNPGVRAEPYSAYEDYVCGEINEPFFETCQARWMNGRQWHVLTYVYPFGGATDLKYCDTEWIDWLKQVVRNGGCAMIDGGSYGSGLLPEKNAAQLKRVFAAARGQVDPQSAYGRQLAEEERVRSLVDAVEGRVMCANVEKAWTRRRYVFERTCPNRGRTRVNASGERVWSDAIAETIAANGGCELAMWAMGDEPVYVDRPIELGSDQSIHMSGGKTPQKGRFAIRRATGYNGPVVVAKAGSERVYVGGLTIEDVSEAMVFEDVKKLFVRNTRFCGDKKAVIELKGVREYRIDGVRGGTVSTDERCNDGILREIGL